MGPTSARIGPARILWYPTLGGKKSLVGGEGSDSTLYHTRIPHVEPYADMFEHISLLVSRVALEVVETLYATPIQSGILNLEFRLLPPAPVPE